MHYYHHVPGRLRIKTPLLKGGQGTVEAVTRELSRRAGVRSATPNIITGSLVIEYDRNRVGKDEILALLKEHGLFDQTKAQHADQYVNTKLSRAGETVGKAIFTTILEHTFQSPAVSLIAALL